jgi:hypothetical protein
MATRFGIGTSLAQKASPRITLGTESGRGPSSTKDLQGSTPIIPEWKAAHDLSQTRIQVSREAEDALG